MDNPCKRLQSQGQGHVTRLTRSYTRLQSQGHLTRLTRSYTRLQTQGQGHVKQKGLRL